MTTPLPTSQDPLIGMLLDERYRVTGVLGRGGMAVVYEATHEKLGRQVAIKVLSAAIAAEPVVVERFLREARVASSLGHGNIVDVSDLGHLPDGRPYLVMSKIEGTPLSSLVAREKPCSPARVVELLRGVASALDVVHAKGLLHRDVKPENLMHVVHEDGSERVLLMDFGIAVLLSQDAGRLTAQGVVCGTPGFLAPESALGEAADQRADVYSLATVAFELLTGALPFQADNPLRILQMKVTHEAPLLSEIAATSFSPSLESVLARGLARLPEDRYASAGAFLQALERAVAPGAARNTPASPAELVTPPPPRAANSSSEVPIGASAADELDERLDVPTAPLLTAARQPSLPRRRPKRVVWISALALLLSGGVLAALSLGSQRRRPSPPTQAARPDATATRSVAAAVPDDEGAERAEGATPSEPEAPAPTVAVPAERPAGKRPTSAAGAERPRPARVRAASREGSARETRAVPSGPGAAELNQQASQAFMAGHVARAAELYKQATERDPRNVVAFRGLALMRERLGHKAAAIAAYRRVLQLAPHGAQADAVRARVQQLQSASPSEGQR